MRRNARSGPDENDLSEGVTREYRLHELIMFLRYVA